MSSTNETEEMLRLASRGYDFLFANDLDMAMDVFAEKENCPLHLMGRGVCAFLKAALGMEPELMEAATHSLALSEQGAKKYMKLARSSSSGHRFQPGIEWEVLHTDAVVLLGLTHALRLFKTLYPNGLDAYATPGNPSPMASRQPSKGSLRSAAESLLPVRSSGFFARWTGFGAVSTPTPALGTPGHPLNGPVEELILSGAAFGYGVFNLVLSLLPTRVRNVVGFLGYNHDRQLALKALAVSAARTDVHSVFAGLVLMTYYGVVLLAAGYQADEEHIVRQYKNIVERVSEQYPQASLWMLNKAKIQRMTGDPSGAIVTLRKGLRGDRRNSFPQADTLLAFELAWTLFQARHYGEAAQMFMDITKMNGWSHATYQFLAAGCYISTQEYSKAQKIMDRLPEVIEKHRSRNMPTEVFIKNKLAFYKKKQVRRGGDAKRFVESMKISPAEELAIVWNTHAHVDKESALAHIQELSALTPPVDVTTEYITSGPSSSHHARGSFFDLDTSDELAVRSLILGIVHRTLGDYVGSRNLLQDALKHARLAETNSWVNGMTYFELAVLDMKEGERMAASLARQSSGSSTGAENVPDTWRRAIKSAKEMIHHAHAFCTREVDLSSRLDSRIVMLQEEVETKVKMLGLSDV
ncbi:hypothetical protein ID866_4102 [Astraeus odoratus]|nr:hypothetical protein ID866_4102 [Astraeus odoratus]